MIFQSASGREGESTTRLDVRPQDNGKPMGDFRAVENWRRVVLYDS